MKKLILAGALVLAFPVHAQLKTDDAQVKRGRYLVQIGGCNDCHTAHYPEKGGKVPEAQWLTGDALGWQGPWGTTYPTNLRLYF
jgi:mono/diheme cytochrome c family protein